MFFVPKKHLTLRKTKPDDFTMMSKKILTICLCLMTITGAWAQKGDWAYLSRYAADNKTVKQLPQEQRRVVFFGNSITDNWARLRPEFFKENGYIGRGISGQTTYKYIVRLREDVINLKPKYVVIGGAINDIAENTDPYNEDITMGNLISLVELLKANKIKVVLASLLPANRIPWNKNITDVSNKVVSLNNRIKAYAKKNHIVYADYYPLLVDEADGGFSKKYCDDGIHPTPAGYEVMEKYIQTILKKLL